MNTRVKDITNQQFGSLKAIQFNHSHDRQAYWQYQCVCGKIHTTRANTVSYQAKKALAKGDHELPSCGCVELARKTKHGYRTVKETHPLYRAYRGIMSRCYDKNNHEYKWYGEVGTTICDEWKNNPIAFIEWSLANGWEKSLHIDKDIKSKELGIFPPVYSPETCQWVSAKVNVSFSTNRDNYGKHPNVKLSHQEVREIVQLYNSKQFSGPELTTLYGLKSPASIYRLIYLDRAESNASV
jgi:hypothetical protein